MSITYGVLSLGVSAQYVTDMEGNNGILIQVAGNGDPTAPKIKGFGLAASGTLNAFVSTSPNIYRLQGPGTQYGFTFGDGVGGGLSYAPGDGYLEGTVQVETGGVFGLQFQAPAITYSFLTPFQFR